MTTAPARPALERSRLAVVGGVSEGLALHLGWTVTLVRVLFVVLTLLGGAGALLYIWFWALVPLTDGDDDTPVRRTAPVSLISIIAAGVATIVVLTIAGRDEVLGWLLVVTGSASVAVAWELAFDRTDPDRTLRYRLVIRFTAVGLLTLAGVTVLLNRPTALAAVLAVGMIVLAVGVVVAPFVVRLWTDLMAQRAARVRELQKAEIAAHLHDSVLQTLALIQNRAEPGSEVARIARAQERELRDWLFAGEATPVDDLAAGLAALAAGIELDFPVRIEVVSAGASVAGHPSLMAAAREAMLNAARHAGGTVSVYLETSPGTTDVYVRDRGPGFRLDDLPADRLGVRESIIGRMERAGGTAVVRRTATGTEVHLHLEETP